MVYLCQLLKGDKFTVNGSDTVFEYSHMSTDRGLTKTYHAKLNGISVMFYDILVNKIPEPEPKEIAIVYSWEDLSANRSYVDVMLRNGFEFIRGQDYLYGIGYRCLNTGKVYSAPFRPNYGVAHTIWLTEYTG